jgi:hypothetical protein
MKKLFVFVEAFAFAAVTVGVITINPPTMQDDGCGISNCQQPASARRGEDHCFCPSGWHCGHANG